MQVSTIVVSHRGGASLDRNEGNGAKRASSHQLRLIGFVDDKRRAGWDGRKKETKQPKRPNTGGRENQFQKWMGYDPAFPLFFSPDDWLHLFLIFLFFHDLITDPLCNQGRRIDVS